jgi:hypothetical protein
LLQSFSILLSYFVKVPTSFLAVEHNLEEHNEILFGVGSCLHSKHWDVLLADATALLLKSAVLCTTSVNKNPGGHFSCAESEASESVLLLHSIIRREVMNAFRLSSVMSSFTPQYGTEFWS